MHLPLFFHSRVVINIYEVTTTSQALEKSLETQLGAKQLGSIRELSVFLIDK